METKVDARLDQDPVAWSGWRRFIAPFTILLALWVTDRGGRAAVNSGIDPLDVLDLTVRNNILFVLDTSGSMSDPPDTAGDTTDDSISKMFQAKDAIKQVVASQNGKVNFGLASFNILNPNKRVVSTNPPLIFVSADANAKDWVNYFNTTANSNFTNYDENTSLDTFQSLKSGPTPGGTNGYPSGCSTAASQLTPIDLSTPASMRCRFYLMSRLYRNNTSIRWNRVTSDSTSTKSGKRVSMTAFSCPLPPAGLVGYNPDANLDGLADKPVPCIQLQDNATGRTAIFYYSGANFQNVTGDTCGGAGLISQVASCDDPTGALNQAVVDAINKAMNFAIPPDASGTLTLKSSGAGSGPGGMLVTPANSFPLSGTTYSLVNLTPPSEGVSATQNTPLGNALNNVRTDNTSHPAGGNGMFPPRPAAAVGLQRNFVILVTDGDDTCGGSVPAAKAAEDLFYESKPGARPANYDAEPTDPQNQATTFVIAFGTGIAPANANVIAQGGSGAQINTANSAATAATCPAGRTCRNAFVASNTAQLVDALNQAIALAASTGTFAASPGVVDNVFEYAKFVAPVGSFDPLNPNSRFKTTAPVLIQPTFELPGYKGHLTAYMNKSTAPACPTGATEPVTGTCQLWDAGQKLLDRLTKTPAGAACATTDTTCMVPVTGEYSFGQLMGTATLASAGTATDLRIRRRIFSTAGNGVATPQVALWPPSRAGANTTCATDPACFLAGNGAAPSNTLTGVSANPLGALDVALGIANMDFGTLQTEFLACTGTPLPAACTDATGPSPNTNRVRQAKREAREILLAAAAGADVVTLGPALKRDASNEVVYRAKDWMLAESSYASPAIITRSPDKPTANEQQEWILFRDGARSSTTGSALDNINLGFGNRNPDKDGTAASAADLNLKPFMSFVLYPANDMLHAFRAGLCPSTAADCNGEGGGDEMWAFVPYDQLGKLLSTRKLQSRTTKVYMLASSIRYGDVFIPSASFTVASAGPQSYLGRWKKLVYFGRGLGGKYYSGLDVTLTGPFTRHSLKTTLPTVLWNRGNPDTDDGQVKTAANSYNNTTGAGAADYTAYLGMGETWSVPALTRVTPASNTTIRTGTAGVTFALYTGSGFSDIDSEGTTFYALDSLTGDVIHSKDVGDSAAAAAGVPATLNALVADAAAYQPNSLVPGTALPNPANEAATRVFIGDLHGRLWKFLTTDPAFATTTAPFADLGADQPIGVAVGLLNYDSTGTEGSKPHVYVSTGGDRRVEVPPAFQMFGFKEESTGLAAPVTNLPIDFPPTPLPGYRGTVQPTTAFNSAGLGRVFFTGTRFNPPGANCVSTFSSIIYALTAGTAQAAYDLSSGAGDDRFVEIGGKVIVPPNTGTGKPEVVTGDRIAAPPPPPPAPQPVGTAGTTLSVYGMSGPGGSPTYRMTSSVCN